MRVQLKDVRLLFAKNLFVASKPRTAAADAKLKYQFEGLIEPGSANDKLLRDAILAVADEKTKGRGAEKLKQIAAAGNIWTLRDGDLRVDDKGDTRPEYKGKLVVSAKNEVRPLVIGPQREPLTLEDGRLYSGCFTNVIMDVQVGDKPKWQVYAYLLGVQFARDGDRIGAGVAAADDFDALPQAEAAKTASAGAAGLF